MVNKWIQKTHLKEGALSRQLGVPIKEDIPMSLLDKIVKSKPGQIIKNPTKTGRANIRVTRLLERRAILARNLKKINSKGGKKR